MQGWKEIKIPQLWEQVFDLIEHGNLTIWYISIPNKKKTALILEATTIFFIKEQRYIASVCHIISLIEFRKPFTQSKCINCIGIQNNNILKKLFHAFIQTLILKLAMLNYG